MGWVFGEAGVPDHGDRVLWDGEGGGTGRQRGSAGALCEARGGREDEVALGDDFKGGREVGDAEDNAALLALLFQEAIDESGAFAARRYEDVVEPGVGFDGETTATGERRVLVTEETLEGVSEKGAALELGIDLGTDVEWVWIEEHRVYREVDVAGFETVGEALGCGNDGQIDRGGLLAESLEECREHECVEQVGGNDPKGAAGVLGCERFRPGKCAGEADKTAA